jgi:hypothetical protein
VRAEDASSAAGATLPAAWAAEAACLRAGRRGMSAARALPFTIGTTCAVATTGLPLARKKPIAGLAFYRKHTVGLLQRYLRVSMELGRTPCVLGNMVFRGRVSSYRLSSFEDLVIFIFDVEKCLKKLDRMSQSVIAHVALEDYPIQEEVLWAFSLPGTWTAVDPTTVDFDPNTGELTFPLNLLGLPYNEVEVTYTAGLATLPDAVKCACAQIVKNAQATPGLNVKSSKMDTLQLQYFGGALVDATVQNLLAPWISTRMG